MITFIATAFEEKYDAHVFIGSMLCQKNPNWKAIIYANGHNQYISSLIANINDDRLNYRFSLENTGYWGCLNRIKALEEVNTEYVVQTSIQDYYTPNAVQEILKCDAELIHWNAIHNHFNHEVLNTQPIMGKIDWGCFAVKTELQRNNINAPKSDLADGIFIDELVRKNITISKINKILTIHN